MKENKEVTLALIVGMLLTDGGISVVGNGGLEIFLSNNSESLKKFFADNLKKLFQDKKLNFKTTHGKIKLYSKEIAEEFLKLSPTFRTRPCNVPPFCPKWTGHPEKAVPHECNSLNGFPPARIPEFVMNGSIEVKGVALKAAMSCDGGIEFHKIKQNNKEYLQRRLVFRCHNPNLLSQWKKLFLDCGFKVTETKNELRITGKEQFKKFRDEIGFIEGVKVEKSKNWKGMDKNELLDIVINSWLPAPKA